MPHLAFDLDALKMVPDAARAAGVAESELGYGLLRLWGWCWTTKTEKVKKPHLAGFFGGDVNRVAEALDAFEFLKEDEEGIYRVRGVKKYLRISEAQSAGGKHAAALGNLKKGHPQAGRGADPKLEDSSRSAPALPGDQLEDSSSARPALHRTPNTEHPSLKPPPTSSAKKSAAQPPAPEVVEEAREFGAWWDATRETNGFAPEKASERDLVEFYAQVAGEFGRDALLAAAKAYWSDEDFRPRGWPLRVFMSPNVWRSRVGAGPPRRDKSRPDPNAGIVMREGGPCVDCGRHAEAKEWEDWVCYGCGALRRMKETTTVQEEAR